MGEGPGYVLLLDVCWGRGEWTYSVDARSIPSSMEVPVGGEMESRRDFSVRDESDSEGGE
jgi:hypothetical protein